MVLTIINESLHLRKIGAAQVFSGIVIFLSYTYSLATPELTLQQGKALSFQRSKGNCLACHVIEEGESPGNIGPPLQAIQSRFSDKAQLRRLIWDATRFNPQTSMPPFGRNGILTEQEIDKVVGYIWSLN